MWHTAENLVSSVSLGEKFQGAEISVCVGAGAERSEAPGYDELFPTAVWSGGRVVHGSGGAASGPS